MSISLSFVVCGCVGVCVCVCVCVSVSVPVLCDSPSPCKYNSERMAAKPKWSRANDGPLDKLFQLESGDMMWTTIPT